MLKKLNIYIQEDIECISQVRNETAWERTEKLEKKMISQSSESQSNYDSEFNFYYSNDYHDHNDEHVKSIFIVESWEEHYNKMLLGRLERIYNYTIDIIKGDKKHLLSNTERLVKLYESLKPALVYLKRHRELLSPMATELHHALKSNTAPKINGILNGIPSETIDNLIDRLYSTSIFINQKYAKLYLRNHLIFGTPPLFPLKTKLRGSSFSYLFRRLNDLRDRHQLKRRKGKSAKELAKHLLNASGKEMKFSSDNNNPQGKIREQIDLAFSIVEITSTSRK